MTTSGRYAHLPLRPCVGVALFNTEGKVFVGERIDTPGSWQMPQGGIDEGEDILLAARRELAEETGITQADMIRVAEHTIHYELPDALVERLWGGSKYRGQDQTWVAMRFTGKDADIHLERFAHPEFSQYQWVRLADTLDLIVPFKRDVYRQVIDLFGDIAL